MNAGTNYLLIVEDDPDILKLLSTTLTFKGYRVVTMRNGKDALEAVHHERPEMIITDIMMPHLDGFGLVHRLRIDPTMRNIPVIFITATYVTPEDKEFALNIGATRFIQKPVDLDDFLKTVEELSKEGVTTINEPLKEIQFYEGYRLRLEAKLEQKNKQIAREELLLQSRTDEDKEALEVSLRLARGERDELKILLSEVDEQMKKITKPD
jgi:DNA-binding response OmpR family regulator